VPVRSAGAPVGRASFGPGFAREYISLFALAKQHGRHFLVVKEELDAAGIKPALDPKESARRSIGAAISARGNPVVELEPGNKWISRAPTIWNPCPVVAARNAGRV
jgi:hypothetical protein